MGTIADEPRASASPAPARWYQQPVAWLGVLLFLASIAGCVWLLVAASGYDDQSLPLEGEVLLKVPLERTPAASPLPSPADHR
jgi:hypothetical protein